MNKEKYFDNFHKVHVEDFYKKGIELVNGGKLFGYPIDITNYKEVIAALYCAYTHKELMVKDDHNLEEIRRLSNIW